VSSPGECGEPKTAKNEWGPAKARGKKVGMCGVKMYFHPYVVKQSKGKVVRGGVPWLLTSCCERVSENRVKHSKRAPDKKK